MCAFGFALASLVLFSGEASAQSGRHQVYHYGYDNGTSFRPGLSVYPHSGWYSRDYPASHRWYRPGYVPMPGSRDSGFYYNLPAGNYRMPTYGQYDSTYLNPHSYFLYGN